MESKNIGVSNPKVKQDEYYDQEDDDHIIGDDDQEMVLE